MWLFDGDCGPCEQASRGMRSVINPPVDMKPYQSVDLDALGVTLADVADGPVLVQSDGSHLVGPAAMAAMMRLSGIPFRQVGAVMAAPGIRQTLGAIGPRLYHQRFRLRGCWSDCQVDAA